MKRLLTSAVLFLCCIATSFAQFSGSGSGTENDPYLILNPIHLNQMRNFLDQSGVYFKLMADIDLTDYLENENPSQGWQPIGSSSTPFKGVVDGNGKTVSGLWVNRPNADNVGFFGCISQAMVTNLNVVATTIVGKDNVGGLAGTCTSTSSFCGCSFNGSIKGHTNVGGYLGNCSVITLTDNLAVVNVIGTGNNVGGFIGKHSSTGNLTISKCHLEEGIIIGADYVGGCFGIDDTNNSSNITISISDTYIHADISGNNYVGGMYGKNYARAYNTINLNNCGYVGDIKGNSYVGGLVGKFTAPNNSTTQNCFALSTIVANGDYIGGLIGNNNVMSYAPGTTITNCYFNGLVSGGNQVGGLVGNKEEGLISSSYANGRIEGKKNIGGLVGSLGSYYYGLNIKKSVAINTRVTATEETVGRIVGENKGKIGTPGSSNENKSYNRTIVMNQGIAIDVKDDEQNGTGVSSATLKLKGTYVSMGFDFTDVWEIQETECFPYFKTQTPPPVILSDVISGATSVSGNCVSGATVTLQIDGVKQQKFCSGNYFTFTVSPLQAGHEVRVSAKVEGKEMSYYNIETVSYLGKGTETNPYQIYTAADLTGVYRKGYFKLMNDIDLTDYINQYSPTEGWESIGREGSETVYFDGNGHKVTGLWCNTTRDNTGLFSCFANGYIKNLTVETANGKQVKGGANTGILIGKMINGTIDNCRVFGNVTDGTPAGGLVGFFDGGTISLSQASVTINTRGETTYVGGLVGVITSGVIDQCVSLGTLTATGQESYVGGLVGRNYASVTNCYSNATVISSYNAAGLIAYNYGVLDKCYATGNLFSSNYAAGVIGYNDGSSAVVKNCVAMNNKIGVVYESQSSQGGGYGQRIIGGIRNGAPSPELNNYALKNMKVSVNNVPQIVYDDIMNGVGKNASDLLQASTYQELGWDFTNTWTINENVSYPTLKNNAAEAVEPVVPEITVDNKTREYGEENPVFTYSVNEELTGEPELTTTATKMSPVGEYEIIAGRGTIEGNYTAINGKLAITKSPLIVSIGTYTIKQGEPLPAFDITYEGFKNNETESVLINKPIATTSAVVGSAPGEYVITISGGEAQNYELSYTNGKLIVVEAYAVFVTANSYDRVYGDANPTFEFTSEGATLTGIPEITCEATESSPVGTYPILISKGSITNYNDTYVNGTLTITKSPLVVKVEDVVREQYQENPEFVISYIGWKVGDDESVLTKKPTATTTATKDSPAGEYEITVNGGEAENYELLYQSGTLTVIPSTDITSLIATYPIDIYSLQGHKLRDKTATFKGLPKGVYIMNGKKVVIK